MFISFNGEKGYLYRCVNILFLTCAYTSYSGFCGEDCKNPPKKQLFRKRKSKPHEWKRNIEKQKRLSGLEYVNEAGKTVHERKLKDMDCSKNILFLTCGIFRIHIIQWILCPANTLTVLL
jgi:hypothetical protein